MSAFTSEQASRARLFAKEEQQRSVREQVAQSATCLSEAKFGATSGRGATTERMRKWSTKCDIFENSAVRCDVTSGRGNINNGTRGLEDYG